MIILRPPLKFMLMLLHTLFMSTVLTITFAWPSVAHEIRPAISDVALSADQIVVDITLTAESLIAGIDASVVQDTNEAPEAEEYDTLRALADDSLAARFRSAWPGIGPGLRVLAGETPVTLQLDEISVSPQADLDLPRDTRLRLSATLPADDSDIRFGWDAEYGPLIVRQANAGDDAYAGFLDGGALSDPLPRAGAVTESAWAVFVRYIFVGFDHIVPKGLDHILFVLGLFFLALQLRPLLVQVTTFTVAHTITLALASLGIVTVPAAIVEPLIAVSIVYVAVENIFVGRITPWRPVVIFLFGLLHGLGFASVLGEFGLAPGRFIAGLIGFNVGVELGQLFVIGIAFLAVGLWFGRKSWYRARIAIPASAAIAIVGAWWAFERVFLG